MSIFPQTIQIVQGQPQTVKLQTLEEPVRIWSQLSNEQQQHLGQIISQMMRCWQATQLEEVRKNDDIN